MANKILRESLIDPKTGDWVSDEAMVQFNDKYTPRVDITDKDRYDTTTVKGKLFAYDKKHNLVIYLFKDDEEVAKFGKDKAPWRTLDEIGMRQDNWDDKEARDEYLGYYLDDLNAEADALAQDFIKNELSLYKDKDGEKE